jgi:predicted glycoside hydrolase/deacetylase ChbG (UPF0249 family)
MMGGEHSASFDRTSPRVVFHADDFGMNPAVNEGILRGFHDGLLTSTALLANAPAAFDAIAAWKRLLEQHRADFPSAAARRQLGDALDPFDLGVHLNLTQGRPLTGDRYPPELLDAGGRFPGIVALFRRLSRGGRRFRAAIEAELCRQIEMPLDCGLRPTHLNGHHYVELVPAVADVVAGLLQRFRIEVVRVAAERSLFRSTLLAGFPAKSWLLACAKRLYAARFSRRMGRLAVFHPDGFFGTAHAGRLDMRLMRLFLGRRGRFRLVEIGMHPAEPRGPTPAAERDDGWDDPLRGFRPRELKMLLSSELIEHLQWRRLRLGRLGELAAA